MMITVQRFQRAAMVIAALAVIAGPASQASAASRSFHVEEKTSWIILKAQWEHPVNHLELKVIPPKGSPVPEADFDGATYSIVDEMTNPTSRAVMVVRPMPGMWALEVGAGEEDMGRVKIAADKSAQSPMIEIVSPADDASGGKILITFKAYDEDSDAKVSLYYDTDRQGEDGVLITDGIVENDGMGEFLWDTSQLPTGDYYIYAVADDEHNPPVVSYSEGRVRISRGADLVLLKESTMHVAAGDVITYTLTVMNAGPVEAEDVVLTEELPEALDLVAVEGPKPEQRGSRMLFELGDIPAGEERTVSMSVTAPQREGWVTNLAMAQSSTLDPIAGNETMTINTRVYEGLPPVADMLVEQSDMPEKLVMGEPIEYTVTVINKGPGRATDVVLDEHLPRIVNFLEATPSQGQANRDGIKIRWEVGSLEPGEAASILFEVGPVELGQITKMSLVKAKEDDPESQNNELFYHDSRIVPEL